MSLGSPAEEFWWSPGHTGPLFVTGRRQYASFAGEWACCEVHHWGPCLNFVPDRTRAVYKDDAADGRVRCTDVGTWAHTYEVPLDLLYVYDGDSRSWVKLSAVRKREARRAQKVLVCL